VYCGGAEAAAGRPSLQALMRGAQEALRKARATAEGVVVLEADVAADATPDDLGQSVREALGALRLRLVGQTAYRMSDHRAQHTEVLVRLDDAAGHELAAARFMPSIVAQGLAEELDRAVIEKVLREARKGEEHISINVSARSTELPAFLAWLARQLARDRGLAARLAFELPEHGLVRNVAAAADFARTVSQAGAAFAIDHFGVHRDCLALLQRLHPAYVKLAGAQVRRAMTDAGAHSFAESLVRTARQLDIPVFAHHVEDEAMFQAIASIGFSGYQGNLGGGPTPWPGR
jgi:EAL domain-containing protein (putative c-di-GMP-specific phosphodiesterase class I)